MAISIYKQYKELKEKHPDAIILFRNRDAYEMYENDAVVCSKVLGNNLITRITINTDSVKMYIAKFPSNSLDICLPKIVGAGYRVAICDKIETSKTCKAM